MKNLSSLWAARTSIDRQEDTNTIRGAKRLIIVELVGEQQPLRLQLKLELQTQPLRILDREEEEDK